MKILTSPYQLRKKTSLNAVDKTPFEEGVLIKVEDEAGYWGVADLKPWPSLGDPSLGEELEKKGLLFQRSLHLAREDLIARKNKISLLKNVSVENNWLLTSLNQLESISLLSGTVKIKGDQQVLKLATKLDLFVEKFPVTLRIDFNGVLKPEEFELFLNSISSNTLKKIEYIEDPTPRVDGNWEVWNQRVPLAIDFAQGEWHSLKKAWTYLIIKPSRQDAEALIAACLGQGKKFTLTSAMDHPVGIAHGLRWAQNSLQRCSGFLTLGLYELSVFNDSLITEENRIRISEKNLAEHGIGMTEALNKQVWQPL